MANYDDVTFGGVTLNITSCSPAKSQKTIKQLMGKDLAEIKILGFPSQQWQLQLNGVIVSDSVANLGTARAAVEALDDATAHAYTDGIHDGDYILVPGSLKFNDEGDFAGMHYEYQMTLVEE